MPERGSVEPLGVGSAGYARFDVRNVRGQGCGTATGDGGVTDSGGLRCHVGSAWTRRDTLPTWHSCVTSLELGSGSAPDVGQNNIAHLNMQKAVELRRDYTLHHRGEAGGVVQTWDRWGPPESHRQDMGGWQRGSSGAGGTARLPTRSVEAHGRC